MGLERVPATYSAKATPFASEYVTIEPVEICSPEPSPGGMISNLTRTFWIAWLLGSWKTAFRVDRLTVEPVTFGAMVLGEADKLAALKIVAADTFGMLPPVGLTT